MTRRAPKGQMMKGRQLKGSNTHQSDFTFDTHGPSDIARVPKALKGPVPLL